MEELKRMIVVADKTVAEFNSREQMFSVPQSQYSQLIYMKQELIPYQQLWSQIVNMPYQLGSVPTAEKEVALWPFQ